MRKSLAMGLGALLLLGGAGTANAASQIDFSGLYRVYFNNHWNQNTLGKTADGRMRTNDSYFTHLLQFDMGFHATDEVSVYWRLQGPDRKNVDHRWGGAAGNPNLHTNHVYGEISQDWGLISIGRLADSFSNLGLASLGYVPTGVQPADMTLWAPFDYNDATDGFRYANRFDNDFQIAVQFNRLKSARSYGGPEQNPTWTGDETSSDLLVVEPAYFWDGGGASLGFHLLRDRTGFIEAYGGGQPLTSPGERGSLKAFFINPAISQSWGDLSFHLEGKAGWGKYSSETHTDGAKETVSGYGLYMDLDYNYGPGNVMLATWWASGTAENNEKFRGLVDMGPGFQPLLVAYNAGTYYNRGAGNNQANPIQRANAISGSWGGFDNFNTTTQNSANHWALALNGAHAFTDDITVRYALANLWLNKTIPGANRNIGFEMDLGVELQLLDNLAFTSAFGYLFAGKALEGVRGETTPADYKKQDAYNWFNTLTFSF